MGGVGFVGKNALPYATYDTYATHATFQRKNPIGINANGSPGLNYRAGASSTPSARRSAVRSPDTTDSTPSS